jgi:hypothetical protein
MVVFHAKECSMIRSKTCFKCNAVKPLEEFYKHSRMADGHVNKCKECNKVDVRENRGKKLDYYREYDKKRADIPKRVAARLEYAQSEAGRISQKKSVKNYETRYPYKKIATTAIGNAIRDGKIVKPNSCQICSATGKIHGHHDDYSKPYEVKWMCVKCHIEWHKNNTPVYPF